MLPDEGLLLVLFFLFLVLGLWLVAIRFQRARRRVGVELRQDFVANVILATGKQKDGGLVVRAFRAAVHDERVTAGFGFDVNQLADFAQNVFTQPPLLFA